VERQAEPREALAPVNEKALGFPSMLESHDEIVTKRMTTTSPCASPRRHRWTHTSNT
jgi:hypothetical protein